MEYRKLANIVRIIPGYAIPSNCMTGRGTPIIKITNIKADNTLDLQNTVRYNQPISSKLRKFILKSKDILVCMTGATIGKIARQIEVGENYIVNQRVAIIRPENPDDFDYVYYALTTSAFRRYVELVGYGAAQPNISGEAIGDFRLNYDSRQEKRKTIGGMLSQYDVLIANNNRRISILEQMAENLYKEWFVRFRFPGHETAEFENGLPKGWNYVKLGDYANISTGRCNREDAEDDGIYPLFDRSQETKKSSTWLKDCEAIIVPGEGTSFIPRYFCGKFNLHQRCYCVEPKQCQMGKFLFHTTMLNRIYFSYVATGATVPSLRQNNFTNMKILMPDIKLVKKFDAIVSIFMNQQNTLKKRNANLIKQRDMLLPRLMSGKLEV